jgi:predicted regulator of amino acid metabolism with ACT domain
MNKKILAAIENPIAKQTVSLIASVSEDFEINDDQQST